MNSTDQLAATGAELDALLELLGATPRSETQLIPRIRSSAFDESELNSTGYFLNARSEYRGEKFSSGISAEYSSEDSTRTERPGVGDPDLGAPDGGDSGRITIDNQRQLMAIAPFFDRELNQRNRLKLAAHYREVSFDRNAAGQVDFSNAGGSVGWAHELSPTATLTLRGNAGTYDPDSVAARDATYYGADAEWRKRFSTTGEAYLKGGARRTDHDPLASDVVPPDVTTSYVAGIGVQWTFLVTRLFIDASTDVDPTVQAPPLRIHRRPGSPRRGRRR
jgi:hypothetical protein